MRRHCCGNVPPAIASRWPRTTLINQEVAKGLLDAVGLHTDLAINGEEALQLAQQNDYAAVLMDMQMPVMDGIAATQAIRQLPERQRLPILAMTANAFADDRQRCLDAGMNDHLAKPVNRTNSTPACCAGCPNSQWSARAQHLTGAGPGGAVDLNVMSRVRAIAGLDAARGCIRCAVAKVPTARCSAPLPATIPKT